MNANETIKALIEEHGIAVVLEAVEDNFDFYKKGHGFRREFCLVSKDLLRTLVTRLGSISAKYGYIPGKTN